MNLNKFTRAELLAKAGVAEATYAKWGGSLEADPDEKEGEENVSKNGKMQTGKNEIAIAGVICLDLELLKDLYEFFFGADQVTTPAKVKAALAECDGDVLVKFDSYGGFIKAAEDICAQLRAYDRGKLTGLITGWSASASTLIQLECSRLEISEFGEIMIHRSSSVAEGDTHDMQKAADYMAKRDMLFAKNYAKRTGKKPEEMLELMDKETWFDSEEAMAIGFVDGIQAKQNDKKKDEDGKEKAEFEQLESRALRNFDLLSD